MYLTMGNNYCIMQDIHPIIGIIMEEHFYQSSITELLTQVTNLYSISDISTELQVNKSTIHRWLNGSIQPKSFIADRLVNMIARKVPTQENDDRLGDFTFIDLFAGIGGIRKGFEQAGGKCLYTSEWDEFAQKTYSNNYPSKHPINGDITKVDAKDIPVPLPMTSDMAGRIDELINVADKALVALEVAEMVTLEEKSDVKTYTMDS